MISGTTPMKNPTRRQSEANSYGPGQTERSMDHVRTGMSPTLNNSSVGATGAGLYQFGGRRFTQNNPSTMNGIKQREQ